MTKNEVCPICNDQYSDLDRKIEYHFSYKPAITTFACDGCNYAEHLIRHPEIKPDYFMENRKELVKKWTEKNKPLII